MLAYDYIGTFGISASGGPHEYEFVTRNGSLRAEILRFLLPFAYMLDFPCVTTGGLCSNPLALLSVPG